MVVSEAAINLKKALENTHICGSKHDPSTKFKAEIDELVNLKCAVFCKKKGIRLPNQKLLLNKKN